MIYVCMRKLATWSVVRISSWNKKHIHPFCSKKLAHVPGTAWPAARNSFLPSPLSSTERMLQTGGAGVGILCCQACRVECKGVEYHSAKHQTPIDDAYLHLQHKEVTVISWSLESFQKCSQLIFSCTNRTGLTALQLVNSPRFRKQIPSKSGGSRRPPSGNFSPALSLKLIFEILVASWPGLPWCSLQTLKQRVSDYVTSRL